MSTKTAPKSQLRLEWVYGYRGHQCRNNLYYNAAKEAVYFVAGVGIVYNLREHRQKFYLGHDDDIISLTLHPEKMLIATGQVGKDPYICVWDSMTVQTVSLLKGGHKQGVGALGFDSNGNRLVSVGLDVHSTINVWEWRKGKILATVRGHSDRIMDIHFSPNQPDTIVSCGVKHIKFWTVSGNTLNAKKGVFGKTGEIQTMLCVEFGSDDITYAGTLNGDIYVWKGNNLSSVVRNAHKGAVHSIESSPDGYASGGKDGAVKLWDNDFKPIKTITLSSEQNLVVRSVCWRGDKVLAGTQDSQIFEIGLSEKDRPRPIMLGHAEGELWALSVHPTKPIFATASDDHTLRIWNIQGNQILNQTTLDHPIRSCGFNNDGTLIAAGLMDGSFMVLRTKDLSQVIHTKDRQEVIHELKFSPDGSFLAIGSNDNFVDIYAVNQRFKRVGQCSGSSSFITHLDWSEDSKYIQTNSGAAERLFFRVPAGKQVTNAEEIRTIRWATWTGVLGPEANGIWEKYTDTNDINATDAHFGTECIVTGDDFGMVKLFRFPSLKKGAKFRKYVGHSAHVTNCRFSSDKSRVITTGGGDNAIFQWKFLPEGIADEEDDLSNQNAYADSNSEDSDSDLSDVAEIDSDIEAERQQSYDRIISKDDIASLKANMKKELGAGQKRGKAPSDGVQLHFVHGYRGFDCRNNVFYLQSGEIIYHVAAVAVIYNREKHSQKFYAEHTDDILCLSVHPTKDVVATGQVGKDAATHIWDASTRTTLSILKGIHERGVCAVDFSTNGRLLATVGLDDCHMIVISDWKKGEKLASTRGHKDKIFTIKWNPHEEGKLITVGMKHIKFWTQAGSGFTSARGTFGNVGKLDSMMCAAFGKTPDIVFTGGANGQVYIWAGTSLKKVVKAHEGPVLAMHGLEKGFVTGGKDGVIALWDESFERCLKTYSLKRSSLAPGSRGTFVFEHPAVRAVVLGHGYLIAGTKNSELVEIDKSGNMQVLIQGHGEGELWGLATHPNGLYGATVSDDRTLRLWDFNANRMVNCRVLKQTARAVCFSPDGKAIAVGMKNGSFTVMNSDSLDDIVTFHHRKQDISDIKFSPDPGKYLAVASHDNHVDIYNVLSSKRVGVCKGASSYITHVDWDSKGKLLMVNTGAKEQLFFEAPRGKRQTLRSEEVLKLKWNSWTAVLGTMCEGIWPPGADVTDVNASSLSSDGKILATGDDFGYVKLFHFPCNGKFAKYKKYAGHSAHVTNVRWTCNDEFLVSSGGGDTSIMVWGQKDRGSNCGASDDSDTDEEEEGYDSDVAREKNIDYTSKTYANPIRQNLSGTKPQEQEYEEHGQEVSRATKNKKRVAPKNNDSKKKRPSHVTNLTLEHIFGYRGWDTRNNLFYTHDSNDVVYHAAGAGIVHNIANGQQSFYTEHTDDIICLAVNEHPKFKNIVATGQIGNEPEINVWNSNTLKTLSVLRGKHKKGICSLSFSASGKLLASVGLDDERTIIVYRWQEGSEAASFSERSPRIFHCAFRPDSDSTFVTVGVKHLKFWTIAGSQLVGKKAILKPEHNMQTMLSVAFGSNDMTYTGAMNGDIFVFKGQKLERVVAKAHSGPIFSMYTTLRDGLIVTGAKEIKSKDSAPVKLWDQEMRKNKPFQLPFNSKVIVVKTVCRQKGKIVVGTRDSEFVEINEKTGECRSLPCGHAEGELWGLTVHPNLHKFVTGSDDGTLRLWDIDTHTQLGKLTTGPARSAHIAPNGRLIACGLKNGGFLLITTETFSIVGQKRDRGRSINDVRFSPDSSRLAVASEDGYIDIYDATERLEDVRKITFCTLQSPIYILDFSADSLFIRAATGKYVNSVFDVQTGKEVKDSNKIDQITWFTWKSILGAEVVGIWPRGAEKADVNCCHVSNGGNAVATGDDNGLVKLFNFPCSEKYSPHQTYTGHSAHVTNVWFTYDDRYVISTGGDDSCVFVWRCR